MKSGGAEGDRTPDLLIANEALSQLSYGPRQRATGKSRPVSARMGESGHLGRAFPQVKDGPGQAFALRARKLAGKGRNRYMSATHPAREKDHARCARSSTLS